METIQEIRRQYTTSTDWEWFKVLFEHIDRIEKQGGGKVDTTADRVDIGKRRILQLLFGRLNWWRERYQPVDGSGKAVGEITQLIKAGTITNYEGLEKVGIAYTLPEQAALYMAGYRAGRSDE